VDLELRMHVLYTIAIILLVLWLLGFTFHVAGNLIHVLLVIAVVLAIWRMVAGRTP
jgi:Family of unknown function (DUF5670)